MLVFENIVYYIKKLRKIDIKIISNYNYKWNDFNLLSLEISLFQKNKKMLKYYSDYYLYLIQKYVQNKGLLNNQFIIHNSAKIMILDSNKLYQDSHNNPFPDYSYLNEINPKYTLELLKPGYYNIERVLRKL